MQLYELGWNSLWEDHFQTLTFGDTSGPSRVIRQDRGQYTLLSAAGPFSAVLSGRFQHHHHDPIDQPAVGDWVVSSTEPGDSAGRIHAILPRKSQFVRKMAGTTPRAQVVAANIDTLLLVTGLDQNFNLRRIERYLALASQSGAEPVIVLNKADLVDDIDARLEAVEAVAGGTPVIALSAFNPEDLTELRMFLRPSQTAALLGSSGVGKSTLLNAFAGEDVQTVQSNRADDSRGRHTTTARELFLLYNGALMIDTPGMRELGLVDLGEFETSGLDQVEALARQCRYANCSHESEPGCAVREAIEAGTLDSDHFESWQRLQRERAYAARRENARLQRAESARWKRLSRMSRQISRYHPKHDRGPG